MSSSPIARILIGSTSRSQGLGVSIDGLGDREDPEYGRRINASELRNQVGSQWVLLKDSIRPEADKEVIFKLSRHTLESGQIWSWLGVYRYLRFGPNERDGTYIGCGFLALNQGVDAERAVPWLLAAIERLDNHSRQGQTGTSRVNPIDTAPVDQIFDGSAPAAVPWLETGLNPQSDAGLYFDLSEFATDRARYGSEIVTFLNHARTEPAFGQYGRLLVGNSTRLAIAADGLNQVTLLTPRQAKAPAPKPKPKPTPLQQIAPVAPPIEQPRGDNSEIHYLREDIQSLGSKVERLANRLEQILPGNPGGDGLPLGSTRQPTTYVLILAILLVFAIIGCTLAWNKFMAEPAFLPTDQQTSFSPPPAPLPTATDITGSEGDIENPASDCPQGKDIPLADKRPQNGADEQLVRDQAECLIKRIGQLNSAASADQERLNTLRAQFKIWDKYDKDH